MLIIKEKYKVISALILIPILALVFVFLFSKEHISPAEAWYSSSWTYRRGITVGNAGSELTNEDVLVILDTASLVTASKLQSDCDDLRFVDSDDTTLLSFWVEGGCNTSTTHVWVRIPTLPNGGKTIYVYYGNISATNAEQSWSGKFILMKNASCDSGWTTESGTGGDFLTNFPFGSSSYGTTSGSARHTHSSSVLQTNTTAEALNVNRSSGASTALNHYHEITITMGSPGSDILPPYLDMVFCSITKLSVKQSQVALYSATAPSGFSRFTALDGKLPRGNSTYGGSSSTTTHTHTLNGNVTTAGPSSTGTCATGTELVPTDTHTHTAATPTAGNGTMMPEYIEMIFAQANSDTMAPSGTITMSNATPPLGWTRFTALDGKFPYGSSTYGATGGSTTHTHTVSATTGNESATVGCSTGTPRTTRMLTHSHTVSADLNSASNNPPYREVLFIQKNTSQSASVGTEETQSANQAPTAPTSLVTEGVTNPTRVVDLTPEFSATYSDPDSDDSSAYQIQVNTQSDFLGTSMWDSTKTSVTISSGSALSPAVAYNGIQLSTNGTTYYWRIKFWDTSDAEGAWSTGTNTFRMNTTPGLPTSLEVGGVSNPTRVVDLLPDFTAVFNDPDGDAGNQYQIQVNTSSAFDGTSMWDSTLQSMTSTSNGVESPAIEYGGTALSTNGTTYYWRIKFADIYGTVSDWSTGTNSFRMNTTPSNPSSLEVGGVSNPTAVTDLYPDFTAVYSDPDGDAGNQYQIQVNTASGFNGTSMWDSELQSMTNTASGTESPSIEYAGTALSLNGATYYWRIRFADIYGTVSGWSTGTNTFTMDTSLNTAPNAPGTPYTMGSANPIKVTTTTPYFSAVFSDSDASDTGVFYQIQVNTNNTFTGTTMWDSTKTGITAITNGNRSSNINYGTTNLSLDGTTYYWRMKFWDNNGGESDWSSVAQFTMSGVPYAPTELLTEGLTNPSAVTDLTPEFSAVHTDPNTDAATHYEIHVNTQSNFLGTSMWDSTAVALAVTHNNRSADISYNGTTLAYDSSTYYWRIRFYDSISTPGAWSSPASFTMSSTGTPTGNVTFEKVTLEKMVVE